MLALQASDHPPIDMYKKKKAAPETISITPDAPNQQKQSNRYNEYENQLKSPGQEIPTSPQQEHQQDKSSGPRKDNFFNLFGETLNEGNLDYINKMLAKTKGQASKDTKKKAGHQRTKSSNVEVQKEPQPAKTERGSSFPFLELLLIFSVSR